jgi:hypothetical protein
VFEGVFVGVGAVAWHGQMTAKVGQGIGVSALSGENGGKKCRDPYLTIRLHQLHIPAEHAARHGIIIGEQTGMYDI